MNLAIHNSGEGSITQCLQRLKEGDSFAEHQLWTRYLPSLLHMAQYQMRGVVDVTLEPDDVASVVFQRFLSGIQKKQICKLDDREDLWQVLLMLTKRTSIDGLRRILAAKRGLNKRTSGRSAGDSAEATSRSRANDVSSSGLESLTPTPEEAALLSEQFEIRLGQLADPSLRRVALAKLSGCGNQEIAEQLGCSLRSVERKLGLIRRKWTSTEELD